MTHWSLDVRSIKKFKPALPRYTEEQTVLKDKMIWWSFHSAGQDFTFIPKLIQIVFSRHILILVGSVQIMLPYTDSVSNISFICVRTSRWLFKETILWIFMNSTASLPITCNIERSPLSVSYFQLQLLSALFQMHQVAATVKKIN